MSHNPDDEPESENPMDDAVRGDVDDEQEVMDAGEYMDEVSSLDTAIDNFTAFLSRITHDHGPVKSRRDDDDDDDDDDRRTWDTNHDLRGRFNVRDEFVKNYLFSQPNDHLAVYEMGSRENEFRGNESMVFEDIDADTNQSTIDARWAEIKDFAGIAEGSDETAPTPPEAKQRLERVVELWHEENGVLEPVPDRVRTVEAGRA